uniref:Uncharacterized protein n=1 Tax=viral metagenome TaxID=1070528 RepID=A0A6C0DP16_9ZZZZ
MTKCGFARIVQTISRKIDTKIFRESIYRHARHHSISVFQKICGSA